MNVIKGAIGFICIMLSAFLGLTGIFGCVVEMFQGDWDECLHLIPGTIVGIICGILGVLLWI